MPEIKCRRCGGMTNTAVADHMQSQDGKADRCFVRWDKGVPEKGCGYDDTDTVAYLTRRPADGIINAAQAADAD